MVEKDLYPFVVDWLEKFLRERHPRADIEAIDTSRKNLSSVIKDSGLAHMFPHHDGYEIRVDVTGIVKLKHTAHLALVECKVNTISLKDVSQLLGYSVVAQPTYSFLLSTMSVSKSVWTIIETFNNLGVLSYGKNRIIRIYKWNTKLKEVDVSSVIPTGKHPFTVK